MPKSKIRSCNKTSRQLRDKHAYALLRRRRPRTGDPDQQAKLAEHGKRSSTASCDPSPEAAVDHLQLQLPLFPHLNPPVRKLGGNGNETAKSENHGDE